jgi:hypothetical protein
MGVASDFISSGIAAGDKNRLVDTLVPSGVETTILNVSGKGIVTSIAFDVDTGSMALTNIKTTVDGAAERTLNYNNGTMGDPSLGTNIMTIIPFAPIRFKTSIVIKANVSGGANSAAKVAYSLS